MNISIGAQQRSFIKTHRSYTAVDRELPHHTSPRFAGLSDFSVIQVKLVRPVGHEVRHLFSLDILPGQAEEISEFLVNTYNPAVTVLEAHHGRQGIHERH